MQISRFAAASLVAASFFASSIACATERVEVPIHQRVLSNGNIRYSIPVSLGGSYPIAAMLDTGSTGLRILAGSIARSNFASITDTPSVYQYNSGVKLNGVIATADIHVGGLSSAQPLPVQLIRSVDCVAGKPHCPASQVGPGEYRIGGDGLPNEGFFVIVGIDMRSAQVDNPLRGVDAQAWIVELPKPGARKPGRLIINPDANDIAGHQLFPTQASLHQGTGQLHDALPGCLAVERTDTRVCGPTLLDTGAPGVHITAAHPENLNGAWKRGDRVRLIVLDKQGGRLGAGFSAGAGRSSQISAAQGTQAPLPHISAGSLPFFFFSVLYDDQQKTVGLKRR